MSNNNIIADLQARRQQESEGAESAYWNYARAIFESKPVDADALDACLHETGRSPEELQRHVELFREVANAEADAAELGDLRELIEAEQGADREHRKLLERHRRIVEKELPQEEAASMQRVRVAEAATKRARRAQAAVTSAYARLRAAQGEVQPERREPEVPRLTYTKRMLPGSSVPRDPSQWDHMVRDDGTTYWRNKRTGAIE